MPITKIYIGAVDGADQKTPAYLSVHDNGDGTVTIDTTGGGGGSGAVTPNFIAATAGSTTVIPINAIGAGIIIITGTGAINGVAWPTGIPWNEPNKLASTVTLVLADPGTAVIYYGT
jgi:hypothetical protein